MLDGECYFVDERQSSWFTARMECLSRGGDLVRITSHDVWLTIKTRLLPSYPTQHYWIGLAGIYWYWNNGKIEDDLVDFSARIMCSSTARLVFKTCFVKTKINTQDGGPRVMKPRLISRPELNPTNKINLCKGLKNKL